LVEFEEDFPLILQKTFDFVQQIARVLEEVKNPQNLRY
jgi:hypothetical protein